MNIAKREKFIKKLKSMALITGTAGVVFCGINIFKGSEKFYEKFVMPVVQLLPPENAHRLAVLACKFNIFPKQKITDSKRLTTTFFSHTLKNPIGIAAGFDKDGEAVEGLDRMGFGFIEVGSVTPLPQAGNEKPRVFRLPRDRALINRYGFNSDGHAKVYERLKALRENENFKGIIGVNLGKNKTSKNALEDYLQGVELFGPIADYLVINVSSPNTPGLRNLQGRKELENLLTGVIASRNNLSQNSKVPILLKVAPDLTEEDVDDIVHVINLEKCKIDGLIVCNTTTERNNLLSNEFVNEPGGLSGYPLKWKSTKLIANLYAKTNGKIPIIGVGGVSSGADAYVKIIAGASYIQFYTALIYQGPLILDNIKSELDRVLETKGYKNVSEAVGTHYKSYLK